MKKCFGYTRVSSVKQGEGVSLEAQREAIQAFADRHDIEIVEWFEEKVTAAKGGRPTFNRMLKLLKARKAEGLVIHKIDRSARNFADWARIGELSDTGIDIHFATESLDFRSRGGRLTADIQAVIAADYIRNLRDETIKGIEGRLKQGLYPFKAPIGYLNNGGGKPKTPDPGRAHHVQDAFRLYATGQYSLMSLLAEMQRRGFQSETGRPIKKHVFETMLSNPFYCGIVRIKGTGATYQGIHEPLISVELFEHVQAIKDNKCGKKLTRRDHLFRGLFRCGHCGGAMIPELQKGHVYYRCHARACPTKCVREEAIEKAVQDRLSSIRLTDQDIEKVVAWFESYIAGLRSEEVVGTLEAQLAQIDQRMDRLTDAYVDGMIDQDTFQRRRERLMFDRRRLTEQRDNRTSALPNPDQLAQILELAKSLPATYERADGAGKRQILETATSNRSVRGKEVEIEPSDWVAEVENLASTPFGDPVRGTSRTGEGASQHLCERLSKIGMKLQVRTS
ncbi:MAG: resolvase [Rhizobiales bacterium NRL2]|jgi:DNA invertase Pin-like site-specific DNA recombinase|nr:MAG: resolvase [Rhizobiales bacterium NRL2]